MSIKEEHVIELYEKLLLHALQRRIKLKDKNSDDVNFYGLKKSDRADYVFTQMEMEDLQLFAVEKADLGKLEEAMAVKYNWDIVWPVMAKFRKECILDKLTTLARTKLGAMVFVSSLDEAVKHSVSVEVKLMKDLVSRYKLTK